MIKAAKARILGSCVILESGCWQWTGRTDRYGYGRIQSFGQALQAYLVAYEAWRGPVPDGLELDHLCRVRICVNPDHLEAVTKTVNTMRGESSPAVNARKDACIHGHPFDDANTYYATRKSGRVRRQCRTCQRIAVDKYNSRKAAA